jgi:hypothetical protein
MLPEFEAAVTGATAGETREFPLVFPADYHGREVAGKEARFVLTVHRVEAPEVPALDSEFAKAFGIASATVDDLRKEVEANLRLELKHKVDAAIKSQALSGLRQRATFAVPKALVDSEARPLRARTLSNMREQPNVKPENLELSLDVTTAGRGACRARPHHRGARAQRASAREARADQGVGDGDRPDVRTARRRRALAYEKPERLRDFERGGARTECRRLDSRAREGDRRARDVRGDQGSARGCVTHPTHRS